MKKYYINICMFALAALGMSSCGDDFLDEMPDNRTEIDTEEKAVSMLVSAYPTSDYGIITELSSDNVDDMGEKNPYSERFYDQAYHWVDITESSNDDLESFWEKSYNAIAVANEVLASMDKIAQNGGTQAKMDQIRAEALISRAYNHFMLLNVFAKHYNKATANTDLGITYMTEPEVTVNPAYSRQSVAECYSLIEKDIEKALPMIGESYMTVPKYHFNKRAAYAFAARFYLYYEKWDKVITCAEQVLGANPRTMLRDYEAMSKMTQEFDAITQHYIDHTLNCNLLLIPTYSAKGLVIGPYGYAKRYVHCPYIDNNETLSAKHAWGGTNYYMGVKKYSATNLNIDILWKVPYLFEYTDAVAGIGFYHSVATELTCDETLIDRAEAYIMLKEYDKACADMNMWLHNISKSRTEMTPEMITTFYQGIDYSYDDVQKDDEGNPILDEDGNKIIKHKAVATSTIKKHLNPAFVIGEEGSVQECMLQCVLNVRRIQTMHEGKRWFDIKRYGIEIPRRVMNTAGNPVRAYDWLTVDDERRALQIPTKSISAGYMPNPRGVTTKTPDLASDGLGGEMIPESKNNDTSM